jgi:rhomboid protease GluP
VNGHEESSIPSRTLLSESPRANSLLISLLGVLIMLLVSQLCWQPGSRLYLDLAVIPEKVLNEGELWRLFTGMAVHADMKHFLSNAVLFGLFSYLLFGDFGFWVYPVVCLLLGALTNYLSALTYPGAVRLVGASGLVYLMAGFWLVSYFLIERQKPVGRRLLHTVGIALLLLMPTAFDPSVSYRAHFVGLALGSVAAFVHFQLRKGALLTPEEPVEVADTHEPENWIS